MNMLNTACSSAWNYPVLDISGRSLCNCCKTPHNRVSTKDLELGTDLFKKFIPIKNIKRDLLEGKKNPNCFACWSTEEVGGVSARTGFDDFARFINATKWVSLTLDETKDRLLNLSDTDKEDLINWEHPTHIEIMLSTTCDLKCLYCSPHFSSQWYVEKLKYKEIPVKTATTNVEEYENIWWNWFETVAHKTVNQIGFVGGEPLLDDKLYQYIERILEIRQLNNITTTLNISVVTNFNTPKKYLEKFLNMVQRISTTPGVDIGICISFESTGNQNDFIRSGASWQLFHNNINRLLEFINTNRLEKTVIYIAPAFCSLSISSMLPFIEYVISMIETNSKFIWTSTTHVASPQWMSPFILTKDYNRYIDEVIDYLTNLKHKKFNQEQYVKFENWKQIFINYLTTIKAGIDNSNLDVVKTDKLRKEFVYNIDKLSARRNLDFNATFPEMVEFYNLCKQIT